MADLYQNELIKPWLEGQYVDIFQHINRRIHKIFGDALIFLTAFTGGFFVTSLLTKAPLGNFEILGVKTFFLAVLLLITELILEAKYPPIINPKKLFKKDVFKRRMMANMEFLGKMQLRDYDLIGKMMDNSHLPKKEQRALYYEALGRDTLKEWPFLKDWIHFYKAEYLADLKKTKKLTTNQKKFDLEDE